MKHIYFTFTVLIMVALQGPLLAQSYYQTTTDVNLRKGPGTSYAVVTSVSPKDQLALVKKENDTWWKVVYQGKTGYISAKYLKEAKDAKSASSHSSGNNNNTKSSSSSNRKSASGKGKSHTAASGNTYQWGVGFRLGDPTGLSVKRFLGSNAVEFNFGRTALTYDPEWRFKHYDNFDNYDYLDGRLRSALSFQLHYLKYKDIQDLPGLQWYYGFGGQLRALTADYYYQYRVYYGLGGGDYRWERRWEKATDLDFGLDGVIGLDYTFPKAPVSVFVDMILFAEIVDNPFLFQLQGGAGIRYNF